MIALVDCNNFYCSCERLFNPALQNKPIVVLSNNDGSVIARSNEAKSLGIGMAVSEFSVRHIIKDHNVAVFSSNYTLYADMSDRVLKILSSFVSEMEIYSIDEAFLSMNKMPGNDLLALGKKIQRTVLRCTGIPVSIGIAATKTLAKIANHQGKKRDPSHGVYILQTDQEILDALRQTAIGDIWGIGKQHSDILKQNGYETAAGLLNASPDWIRQQLSVVGERTLFELRGVAAKPLEVPKAKKNISITRSLPYRADDRSLIEEAIANYAAACALKLRQQCSVAKRITVFVQTNPFIEKELQHTPCISLNFDRPTSDTGELIGYSMKALDLIVLKNYQYQRAGVQVEDLVPEEGAQSSLFDIKDRSRSKKIMLAIDAINSSLGREIVRFSRQRFEKRYLPKASFLSQRFTTRMDETLHIKI